MAYQSISVDHPDDQETGRLRNDNGGGDSGHHHKRLAFPQLRLCNALVIVGLVLIAGDWARLRLFSGSTSSNGSDAVVQEDETSPAATTEGHESSTGLIGSSTTKTSSLVQTNNLPPLPPGVNFGSWLSLEDYFYVGSNGAVEVASPDDAIAATCLPPLHLDKSTGPRWNSETDLFAGLADHYHKEMESADDEKGRTLGGYPNDKADSLGGWGKAIRAIHAFRSSYIDFDDDLQTLSDLGIKYVRVPVSWCWTDHDPFTTLVTKDDDDDWVYMDDEEVLEKFACKDPFYDDVYWPAIPKSLVQRFLRACAKHGIGASLGMHDCEKCIPDQYLMLIVFFLIHDAFFLFKTFTLIQVEHLSVCIIEIMHACNDVGCILYILLIIVLKSGTFSGVWPRYSRFWTHGDLPATDNNQQPDVGRTVLKDFIEWLESLADSDPMAFEGLRALSPMNEPAHLAGLYNGKEPVRSDRETFLPPLTPDMAQKYLSELNEGLDSQPQLTKVPDGNHLRVFLWIRDAIDTFRQSKLPSLGKELHVNVHESLFPADVLPKTKSDYGLNTASMKVFGAWWRAATTAEERSKWAVLDIHHYHAWGPECSGAVEGPPTGRYACSDEETKAQVLGQCATWSQVYRSALESECEKGLRLASAEFSASTHHSVRHACNDLSTLKMMLESQVNVAKSVDVELFWWSYKMPYGGAFRRAWSLKHLLYLMGVLPQPDEAVFHCGDHTPPPGEPRDGSI
ncbi:hypothetical protein ACHAXR_010226 [Thalassiosira sp. AJA248-18]